MEKVFKDKKSASNKDPLTEYLRCFLMQEEHEVIREKELFAIYRNKVKSFEQVTAYLEKLKTFLPYYERISEPQKEPYPLLRKHLERMNKLENKNAYPLCLKCYAVYAQGNLTVEEFIQILNMLENFIIRRFVCGDYAYEHIRIFTMVVLQCLGELKHNEFVEMIRYKLASKKYRTDEEVKSHFLEKELYEKGSENKTQLILETLEEHLSAKPMIASAKPSLEHILPKNDDLKRVWKEHLGENWKAIHKKYVHTIGNLTLTYHNSALGEKSFDEKKDILSQYDDFALNKYFYQVPQWQERDIIDRSKWLAEEAIKIWKYFGHSIDFDEDLDVTGTKPKILTICDKIIPVKSWREVLVETFNTIYDLDSEKFDKIVNEYPKWIEKEENTENKGYLPLKKVGYYANVRHHNANNIRNICEKAMDIIGFKQSWKVDLEEVAQEKNLFIG
jgi:hypothetical protein